MNTENASEILNQSLTRCTANPQFLRIFYEHLLDTSPAIKALFDESNMESHMEVVKISLMTMVSSADSDESIEEYLKDIAQKHVDMDIKPEFFKFWEISLMATIAECDPDYNEQIRRAWKTIISKGINYLLNYK